MEMCGLIWGQSDDSRRRGTEEGLSVRGAVEMGASSSLQLPVHSSHAFHGCSAPQVTPVTGHKGWGLLTEPGWEADPHFLTSHAHPAPTTKLLAPKQLDSDFAAIRKLHKASQHPPRCCFRDTCAKPTLRDSDSCGLGGVESGISIFKTLQETSRVENPTLQKELLYTEDSKPQQRVFFLLDSACTQPGSTSSKTSLFELK